MSANPPLPAAVADDLACLRCRYNLRTLPSSSACPECGTPVAQTLLITLRLADPQWLRLVLSGSGWLCAATIAGILTGLYLISSYPRLWSGIPVDAVYLTRCAAGTLVAIACWVIGVWKLASRAPGRPEPVPVRRARRWLMATPALALLLAAIFGALLPSAARWFEWRGFLNLVFISAGVGLVPLAARLRDLFAQLSAPGLARQARWVLWSHGVLLALLILVWLPPMAAAALPGSRVASAEVLSHWLASLWLVAEYAVPALLVAPLWTLFLLVALRRRLRTALRTPAPTAGPTGDAPAAGTGSGRVIRAVVTWTPIALGVGLLVLNLWTREYHLTPIPGGPAGPTPIVVVHQGWPQNYLMPLPRVGSRPFAVSLTLVLTNVMVAGVLIALTEALRRDALDRWWPAAAATER